MAQVGVSNEKKHADKQWIRRFYAQQPAKETISCYDRHALTRKAGSRCKGWIWSTSLYVCYPSYKLSATQESQTCQLCIDLRPDTNL